MTAALIASLRSDLARVTRQRDSLAIAHARSIGRSERVVRLEFGIDQEPEGWAEDSERGAR